MARWSIGSGRQSLELEAGVRLPYGLLVVGQVVELADTPSSEGGALDRAWECKSPLGHCFAGVAVHSGLS